MALRRTFHAVGYGTQSLHELLVQINLAGGAHVTDHRDRARVSKVLPNLPQPMPAYDCGPNPNRSNPESLMRQRSIYRIAKT